MSKIFLFVDGSNLYNAQYELFGPNKYLDFNLLIKSIERSFSHTFTKIYFYASYSPRPKNPSTFEKKYLKNEALFYQSVKQTPKTEFFKGYRSKTSGKEKEVDVKLAVDLVDFAHRKKFSKAFLFSGDADFMQALDKVKILHLPAFVVSMNNKIMFKSLLFYTTYIIRFNNKKIDLYKIKKKPYYLTLSKNLVVKPV